MIDEHNPTIKKVRLTLRFFADGCSFKKTGAGISRSGQRVGMIVRTVLRRVILWHRKNNFKFPEEMTDLSHASIAKNKENWVKAIKYVYAIKN